MPKFDLYTHDDAGPPRRRWTLSRIFAWTILGFSMLIWAAIIIVQN
jgi:hypothetical protein